jgi:hypothetical protein
MKQEESNKKASRGRRQYDNDFKSGVIKMLDNAQNVPEVCQRLGIGELVAFMLSNGAKINHTNLLVSFIFLRSLTVPCG